jgi:hypothetical protein
MSAWTSICTNAIYQALALLETTTKQLSEIAL